MPRLQADSKAQSLVHLGRTYILWMFLQGAIEQDSSKRYLIPLSYPDALWILLAFELGLMGKGMDSRRHSFPLILVLAPPAVVLLAMRAFRSF